MEFEIKDGLKIGGGNLVVIAGPCMAESLDICLETAERMKAICSKLELEYVFKASFDKANRSAADSFRGPGLEKGLEMLAKVAERFNLPTLTDIHLPEQAERVAEVVDILQIPAFLCRQTDLLVAAGETGKAINVKKGQFMSPREMSGALEKVKSTGNDKVLLTERGTFFGYNNLVVDMRSLVEMRALGAPVVFDATHSVQTPGGLGKSSGGRREFVRPLARAASAVGIDALFLEAHPNPDNAKSDGPNSVDFKLAETILEEAAAIAMLQKKRGHAY
jgi:2-dehydro-3-deoxyphosphooctonate aldolase (KDO 8-P synthase)